MSRAADNYYAGIRAATRGLWTGALSYDQFFDAMDATIRRGLPQAWHEGAQECGIAPSELSSAEKVGLQQAIVSELNYIDGFATAIEAGSKANGGKLEPLMSRADLWVARYNDVTNRARVKACADKKLMWVWNPRKEHCADCARLNGRVYRASTWDRYGLRPQSPDLECKGFKCGCSFAPTDESCTPGRPPSLVGGAGGGFPSRGGLTMPAVAPGIVPEVV